MTQHERIATLSAHLENMATLSSHVLDTSVGKPADKMIIDVEGQRNGEWYRIEQQMTNADGRAKFATGLTLGIYRVRFYTQAYFEQANVSNYFYPQVMIHFQVQDAGQHYHVPLLLNPFGYSTYRGS